MGEWSTCIIREMQGKCVMSIGIQCYIAAKVCVTTMYALPLGMV